MPFIYYKGLGKLYALVRYYLGFRSLYNFVILFSLLCTEKAFEDRKGKGREEKQCHILNLAVVVFFQLYRLF